MNPFTALQHQPPALHSVQLLLVGLFLASYVAAVTGLLEPRGRLRAAALASAAGLGMGFVFTPWTLGALLAALSIGAVGVFIGASWLLSRALGVHEHHTTLLPEAEDDATADAALPAPRLPAMAEPAPPRFAAPTAPAPLS
ncbi:MAG: hypothetical protein AB7U92_11645 [Piscinibacter sp.]|uniref:hypothetical protein n=1 Tax=Piscinibacter sp. TaxID=1903157 RepID=UPI003D137459